MHLLNSLKVACEAACSADEKEAMDGRLRIQDSFDQFYPGIFRVCIFSSFSQKPIFIGHAPKPFFNLAVLQHDRSNYSAIDGVSHLFGRPFYCFECCKTYSNSKDHTMHCIKKCKDCTRIGRNFPCIPDADGLKTCCSECNKLFANRDCYETHKFKGVCAYYKKCPLCRCVYNTRGLKHYTTHGLHVCGHEFCFYCLRYHPPSQGCDTSDYTGDCFIDDNDK